MDQTPDLIAAIPIETVRHALYLAGDYGLGVQPGRFVTGLWGIFASADDENLRKLWQAWPELALAHRLVHGTPEDLEMLRDRAKNEPLSGLRLVEGLADGMSDRIARLSADAAKYLGRNDGDVEGPVPA